MEVRYEAGNVPLVSSAEVALLPYSVCDFTSK